jgi:hypothetical protein
MRIKFSINFTWRLPLVLIRFGTTRLIIRSTNIRLYTFGLCRPLSNLSRLIEIIFNLRRAGYRLTCNFGIAGCSLEAVVGLEGVGEGDSSLSIVEAASFLVNLGEYEGDFCGLLEAAGKV